MAIHTFMNCFLIDFENVKSSGLKGIERLTDTDDVYIFYSDYANNITFDVHHKMNQSKAKIELFRSTIFGKNSLDFQLVSYLGYLVAQNRYQNYYVVTNDRGFESAVKFWKDFFKQNKLSELNINRYRSIQDTMDKKNSSYVKPTEKRLTTVIPTVEPIDTEKEVPVTTEVENVTAELTSTVEKPERNSRATTDSKKSYESRTTGSFRNKSVYFNQSSQKIVTTPNNFKSEPKSVEESTTPEVTTTATTQEDSTPKKQTSSYSYRSKGTSEQNGRKPYSNYSTYKKKNQGTTPQNQPKKPYSNSSKPTYNSKPKSFVFGKVDLNEDIQNVENIQSKSTDTTTTTTTPKSDSKPKQRELNLEELTETIAVKSTPNPTSTTTTSTVPTTTTTTNKKPKDTKDTKEVRDSKPNSNRPKYEPKKDTPKDTPKDKDRDRTTDKPTTKTTTNPTTKTTDKKPPVKNTTTKNTTTDVKRKVGRPRTRPIEDESKKPKNNKKFQGDIPSDTLNLMLERVSQLGDVSTYSHEYLVKVCKIIAFSETRQECYNTFVSCFGKNDGVKIYNQIKQQVESIRSIYKS